MKKRILILSDSNVIFHIELKRKLMEKNYKVKTILTSEKGQTNAESDTIIIKPNSIIKKIPKIRGMVNYYILFLIEMIKNQKNYDIINIHFVSKYICKIVYFLYKMNLLNKKKIVLTFYGSDFYRNTLRGKKKLEKIIKISDKINFTNKSMLDEVSDFFENKYIEKMKVVRFGLSNLEEIINSEKKEEKVEIKNEYNIENDKLVVTCGYNAIQEQEHERIIEELKKLKNEYKNKIFLIFPMNYGKNKEQRIEQVKKSLNEIGIKYYISKDYLKGEQLAKLRRVSDVMINVQKTDQFSGSMQEYIFSGNIIIAGNWLPYQTFIQEGIEMLRIENISQIREKLIDIIDSNLTKSSQQIEKEKKIIWELSSWEKNIKKWEKLFFGGN